MRTQSGGTTLPMMVSRRPQMMGDGVIELRKIRGWMEDAGYAGFAEVEIFSEQDWWLRPGDEVLDTCMARHRSCV